MNVAELIAILEDYNPDLPVMVKSDDSDFDYMPLMKEDIEVTYSQFVPDDDEDADGDIEIKILALGKVV